MRNINERSILHLVVGGKRTIINGRLDSYLAIYPAGSSDRLRDGLGNLIDLKGLVSRWVAPFSGSPAELAKEISKKYDLTYGGREHGEIYLLDITSFQGQRVVKGFRDERTLVFEFPKSY